MSNPTIPAWIHIDAIAISEDFDSVPKRIPVSFRFPYQRRV